MLPINLCSVATSNQGNGARRHAVICMMKSFACRPMPAAAVGPSDTTDLLTAAQRPVSTFPISFFLLYYGCGSPYWMSFLKTMTVTGPAQNQDHKNQFRSLLHVLFLTDLSVYFPSLVLNEPSDIKHYSGRSCWCNCEVCLLNFLLTSKWKMRSKEGRSR